MIELFLTFLRIGLFTFGGGYAMLSLIENACVENKKWITHEEMMTVTVIAESTPGPVAINCATFVGYKRGGFWGAVAATLGVVLPSFVIIYVISRFLDGFLQIAMVTGSALAVALIRILALPVSTVTLLLGAALIGIAVRGVADRNRKEEAAK